METEILLGDEVRCKYTGVKGVTMARTEFINGCVQFSVAPKWNPNNPGLDGGEVGVDSQSLVIIKKGPRHKKVIKKKPVEEKSTGGPMRRGPKMRGW